MYDRQCVYRFMKCLFLCCCRVNSLHCSIDVENNIANGRVKRNTDDYDDDLNPILEKASNEQLQPLVEIITGAFSNFLEIEEAYKAHHPNHVMKSI